MVRRKVRRTFDISRRLYRVLSNITPLFLDFDLDDPSRGAMTRALEDILQFYSETPEYAKKVRATEINAKKFFKYLCEKDRRMVEEEFKG